MNQGKFANVSQLGTQLLVTVTGEKKIKKLEDLSEDLFYSPAGSAKLCDSQGGGSQH